MAPDTWQVMSLADICDEKISYGIVQAGPHVEDGVPYIKSSDLNSELKLEDLQRTAVEIHKKYIRSTVRPGDIVFSLRGNIGLCRIVPGSIYEANLTQGTARISIKPEHSTEFFLQQITGPELNKSIQAKAKGSTFQEISLDALRKVPVLVPPKDEQTKIAQILSTWDKAITTTELLLANSQQQKQALMQQLLTGQTRFAGFTEDWMTIEFDELLDIEIGGTPSRSIPAYWDPEKITNNRWLSIADLKGNIITDTSEHISDLGAAKSNTKLIPAGTIVMSFKLTIGRRAILAADTYTNEAICALKIKDPERLSNDFLFHALCLVNFEQDIDQAVKGKTLNKAKLKQLTLNLPSLPEQQKIAQVLSTADAEIGNLQAQLDKLKLEKKALMQQLLTGKRRVRLDDEEEDLAPIRRVG